MDEIDALERKVFCYNSSIADKRFFKQKIIEFLKNGSDKSFTQFMFSAIWERNDGGKTLKYCYFNEHVQRVFIDKDFYTWMVKMIEYISHFLEKLKEQENYKE